MCVHSCAQLLKQFQHSHHIPLISGDARTMSGNTAVCDLDQALGTPTAGMMQSSISVAATTDIRDPPGLYEKVKQ